MLILEKEQQGHASLPGQPRASGHSCILHITGGGSYLLDDVGWNGSMGLVEAGCKSCSSQLSQDG